MDDLHLYHEEQRKKLIDLHESIQELSGLLKQQLDQYTPPPSEVGVKGEVEVTNPQSQVNVENLNEVVQSVSDLEKTLTKAIEDNSYQPLDEVTVKNISEAKSESIHVDNLSELKSYFDSLTQSIHDNQPIVEKQEVVFPKSPSEAIPVRLSDGQSFYKAVASLTGGGALSFKDQNNRGVQVQVVENTNELGTYSSVPVMTGSRPSDLPGRTAVRESFADTTTDMQLFTNTADKTFYLTDIIIMAENAGDTGATAYIRDGTDATGGIRIPIRVEQPQGSSSRLTTIEHSFIEPVVFDTGVYYDEVDDLTTSVIITGYEE